MREAGIHNSAASGPPKQECISRGRRAALDSCIVIAGFHNPLSATGGIGTVMRINAPYLHDLTVVCLNPAAPEPYRETSNGHSVYPVSIPADVTEAFHRGFCKSYIWPMLHEEDEEIGDPFACPVDLLENVQTFSKLYAIQLIEVIRSSTKKPLLWFNDYAMIPVLREFRACYGEDLRIGLSLRSCFGVTKPPRFEKEVGNLIVEGMLSADVISFHRARDVAHFSDLIHIQRLNNKAARDDRHISTRRGRTALRVVPMGSSPAYWYRVSVSSECRQLTQCLQNRYRGQSVILSVSRLEPHKNIAFEFEVIEQLLTRFRSLQGKVHFIRITPIFPEYERLRPYAALKNKIDGCVGRINDHFGTRSWKPVELLCGRSLPHKELAAYYRVADVVMVLSKADGYNHVSVEAVLAKQKRDRPLTLLLSDTGSSDYLRGGFIEAGSQNAVEVANKLSDALKASEESRRGLHESLLAAARARLTTDWMFEMLGEIAGEDTHRLIQRTSSGMPPCADS